MQSYIALLLYFCPETYVLYSQLFVIMSQTWLPNICFGFPIKKYLPFSKLTLYKFLLELKLLTPQENI